MFWTDTLKSLTKSNTCNFEHKTANLKLWTVSPALGMLGNMGGRLYVGHILGWVFVINLPGKLKSDILTFTAHLRGKVYNI